jgi:hypothetical protein
MGMDQAPLPWSKTPVVPIAGSATAKRYPCNKKAAEAIFGGLELNCVTSILSVLWRKLSGRKHFLWQDLYPIVANHPHRLAQHFKQLMAEFGMVQNTPIIGWQTLFDSELEQCQAFRNTLKDSIRPHFHQLGASCAMDGEDLWAYRIKYPQEAPWLHLMYIYARAENKSPRFNWEKPSLNAAIWLLEDNPQAEAFYNHQDKFQSPQKQPIMLDTSMENWATMRLKDGAIAKAFALYYTDLSAVLSTDLEATQSAILDFTTAVYAHAKEIINSF